jgi:hypothetical protein
MEKFIQQIIDNPRLHARWLNTLSMMENAGARKIKACEDPVFVNEIILKHAAEEARHAYFLKKQIAKIEAHACPTYERAYLLAPTTSYHYLNALDVHVCRYLKRVYGYHHQQLKYAAYLLVTYAIEVRADALYPVYQAALTAAQSKVTVHSIIAEEKNHLAEMTTQLKAFSAEWEAMTTHAVAVEAQLWNHWVADLATLVAAAG